MNTSATDYQKVITEVLQKQMIILGPEITLLKARNVQGLKINDDGKVLEMEGNGHAISVKILEEFRELSPLMVKKTMRPLLNAILYSPKNHPAVAPDEEKQPEQKAEKHTEEQTNEQKQ